MRIPSMRGDEGFFDSVADLLFDHFDGVLTNSYTGTVLVCDPRVRIDTLCDLATEHGLFELGDDDSGTPASPRVNARGPYLPLAGALVALAGVQAIRGQTMIPAASLLWYALEATRWARERS